MNTDQSGLKGEKSRLFWEYVRIRKETNAKYFLLENVASAPTKDLVIISKTLGVPGVRINSSLVSAQLRDRYYWTNIPGSGRDIFGNSFVEQPSDKQIYFKDIIESGYVFINKKGALLARDHKSYSHRNMQKLADCLKRRRVHIGDGAFPIVFVKNELDYRADNIRKLTKKELERLQTVAEGYTSCISYSQAQDVLGDGWTVDVVCHLLQGLKNNSL